jgi:hypothetical protein
MGSPSSSQQSSQQQISQVQLPPWINQAAQQNYALAQDVANRPLTQFQGQQVADVGPQMQQAWNLAAGSGGAGADQYNAAQAGYLTAAGYNPMQVKPQTLASLAQPVNNMTNMGATGPTGGGPNYSAGFDPGNVAQMWNSPLGNALSQANNQPQNGYTPYMNPYTQSVINTTLPLMQQQLNQAKMGIGDQATQARAFGGSRQGVQEGVADAQGALNMGQMASQLNQANFQQAQAAATGDITRDLQAQQGNQTANQAAINSLLQASQGLGGLGTQAQTNQRQQFLELSTAGAQQQQQAQAQIDAQKAQFQQANNYPLTQLGILQSGLTTTPYGSTTMGASSGQQQTQQNNGIAADIFGGLQSLGGMFGAGGPFGAGGALASLMPGSDRHLKTDITKVGVHPPTGLPLFSYRYKGDPKTYPKITGPMAEDAMQVAPHAVRTLGVHAPTGQALHGVDMGALDAMGAVNDNAPAIRPRRVAGAMAPMRVPGPLTPAAPTGLTGALGASMRAPRMRPRAAMPRVRGGLSG